MANAARAELVSLGAAAIELLGTGLAMMQRRVSDDEGEMRMSAIERAGATVSRVPFNPSSRPSGPGGDAVSHTMNQVSSDDHAAFAPAARATSQEPTSVAQDDSMPLVWVEAEHVFVARGYVYRVSGSIPGHVSGNPDVQEDSETVLDYRAPDQFTVLSSRSPADIAATPPEGWTRVEPARDLDVGARIGEALVARRHGGNEYTVVHPTASIEDDPAL